MKNFTYIIPFKNSPKDREDNLHALLEWIFRFIDPLEVIVVEQDSESKVNLSKYKKLRHIFIFNDGLINKCWAMNVGAMNAKTDILAFGDSDIVMNHKEFIDSVIQIKDYEFISPYKQVFNLNQEDTNKFYQDIGLYDFPKAIPRPILLAHLSGGSSITTKEAFWKVGAWCESFRGWGCEDGAQSSKVQKLLSYKIMPYKGIHLNHGSDANNNKTTQPNFHNNAALEKDIKNMPIADLLRFIQGEMNSNQGNVNKYKNMDQ